MIHSENENVHLFRRVMVVGSFFTENIKEGAKSAEVGEYVTLKREKHNKFDVSAVAVYNRRGIKLGYVAREQNAAVANVMDSGLAECYGIITSLNKKRSSVGMLAELYLICDDDNFMRIKYIIQRS